MTSTRHSRRRLRRRSGRAAVALACLAALALLQVSAGPALAEEGDPVPLVGGRGLASFGSGSEGPLAATEGCRFDAGVTLEADVVAGTFRCRMSEEAVALGVPFSTLVGAVTATSDATKHLATLSGTATLQLPDQQVMEDVGYVVAVREGRVDQGGLRIVLLDVFDEQPGDTLPGDGHYSLPDQILSMGHIRVAAAPEPEPPPEEPPPDPEPPPDEPDPEPPRDRGDDDTGGAWFPPAEGPNPALGDAPTVPSGVSSTARLMALLAQASSTGTPAESDVLSVVGPFPVAGLTWWQDDWHAYRCCPYIHEHQGLDMFAARGTPVVAAADGLISQKVNGSISGLGVEVTDSSGTQYFYAHLDGFALGLSKGSRVERGDVLGYVGNTGNARGTSSHLHFEIQPGGIPIPPKPLVDAWLALAESEATALVEERTGAEVEEPSGVLDWLNRAEDLAGDSSAELTGEGLGPIAAVPVARRSPPVASAAMTVFAAGMFLMLLVGPGVVAGRRQAARQLRTRRPTGRSGPSDEPIGLERERRGRSGRLRAAR